MPPINTDLNGKDWKQFRAAMREAGWKIDGSSALAYFIHPNGSKFMPFDIDARRGDFREAWVKHAAANTTPPPF